MGTRGCFGVRINETDKLMYNHWDSYPSGLGCNLVEQFFEKPVAAWRELAANLKVVKETDPVTEQLIQVFAPYTDLSVSEQSTEDWYCLFRHLQGELGQILEFGYILDAGNFMHDSLDCEWAYIFNFDTNELEVYEGFNKNREAPGRYASTGMSGYAGVALIASFPFDDLSVEDVAELESENE